MPEHKVEPSPQAHVISKGRRASPQDDGPEESIMGLMNKGNSQPQAVKANVRNDEQAKAQDETLNNLSTMVKTLLDEQRAMKADL